MKQSGVQNFPVPERIRGMIFSSARENKRCEFFESPEFDFVQASQSVRDRSDLIFYIRGMKTFRLKRGA